jgi:oxygen-independent coproporphyrinogen III oxidase
MTETACYIHIPFCDHKCVYCDFYSIITSDNIQSFLKYLKKEISHYAKKYSDGRELISIYFGGGTPSLMEPEYLSQVIQTVKENFFVRNDAEITMETNPGTVSFEKMKMFRELGINRISIGIQSFDNEDLNFLTRIHNSETAIRTVNDAADAGFENISLDLIFNLPGQTKKNWKKNLEQAIKLPVKHISAYSLILERGTILNKMVLDGKIKIEDADYDAELYETTINFLTSKGFDQYEVSNFAKPVLNVFTTMLIGTTLIILDLVPQLILLLMERDGGIFQVLKCITTKLNNPGMLLQVRNLLAMRKPLMNLLCLS